MLPLQFVGNLARPAINADVTTSGNERRESRTPHYLCGKDVTEIWFLYATWWLNLGARARETALGNGVSVYAALEYNGVSVQAPNATIASPLSVADDSSVLVGPFYPADFGVDVFPAGAQIFARTGMIVTIGQALPRSGMYLSDSPASRRNKAVGDASEVSATGLMTGGTTGNAPGPQAIIGRPKSREQAWIAIGDSIAQGDGDGNQYPEGTNAGGWIQRASQGVNSRKIPVAHASRSGGTISQFRSFGAHRREMIQYAKGGGVILIFGANDLFDPTPGDDSALSAYISGMEAEFVALRAAGAERILVATVQPRTTGTFTSDAGQTVATNWWPEDVAYINDTIIPGWLSSGLINGVFDLAARAESATDATKWTANGTTDGTHAAAAVHALQATDASTLFATFD